VNTRVAIGIGVLLALVAGIVILLASGGPVDSGDNGSVAESGEPTGDVVVGEGNEPPGETALADIVEAEVRRRGSGLLFRARMADRIPPRVKGGGMSWRWDIYEAGVGTWILSSNLDIGPVTSLTSTQSNYGSSTFDDSFPGTMTVEGHQLKITLRAKDVEDWPDDFEWVLGTQLDGSQGNPRSALATDTFPDEGRGTVED
jgi:hypothetical protein